MHTLRLDFRSEGNTFSLYKSEFRNGSDGSRYSSARGASLSELTFGQFEWSSAVHALCILCVRHAARNVTGNSSQDSNFYVLAGEKRTPAASLDYALGKQPLWLQDMFGLAAKGRCIASCIILRENPERKRPGPVRLAIDLSQLAARDTEIRVDDQVITEALELIEFAQCLENDWHRRFTKTLRRSDAPSQEIPSLDLFFPFDELLFEEAGFSLQQTDIFSRRNMRRKIERLTSSDRFRQAAGTSCTTSFANSFELSPDETWGLSRDTKKFTAPTSSLQAWISTSTLGALTIFRRLASRHPQLNLQIDFDFQYTRSALDAFCDGDTPTELPDFIVLGAAESALFLRSRAGKDYLPLMFAPHVRYALAARGQLKEPAKRQTTRYLFVRDTLSSASLLHEELEKRGFAPRNSRTAHVDDSVDALEALASTDSAISAIMPYRQFALASKLSVLTQPYDMPTELSLREDVLFVHRRISKPATFLRRFSCAVRDIWLELIERPELLRHEINSLTENSNFRRLVLRSSGWHVLNRKRAKNIATFSSPEAMMDQGKVRGTLPVEID